jgi:transposase
MPNATRWVGLDVHASQTACAIFDSETGEVITRRVLGRPHEVMGVLLGLERPVHAVYEAGPTGYGLARRSRAAGIDMQVCAPGMIARSPTERIKTDKRDAMKLARLHARANWCASTSRPSSMSSCAIWRAVARTPART